MVNTKQMLSTRQMLSIRQVLNILREIEYEFNSTKNLPRIEGCVRTTVNL